MQDSLSNKPWEMERLGCTSPDGREFVSDGEAEGITLHAFEITEFGRCRYCGKRDDYRTGPEIER